MYTQQLKRLKQWLLHENGVRLVVLLGVIGLVMILLSGLHDTGSKETKSSVSAESATDASLLTAETYCRDLEEQLQQILGRIDGVGACQVLVTANNTASYVYQQDASVSEDAGHSSSQQQCVLVNSSGTESPLLETIVHPKINGLVIVCEGGDRNVVKEQIIRAVSAALNLRTSQICVAKQTS